MSTRRRRGARPAKPISTSVSLLCKRTPKTRRCAYSVLLRQTARAISSRGRPPLLNSRPSAEIDDSVDCGDDDGGEISRFITGARKGDRACNIDPPALYHAAEGRPYGGENSGPGED